MNTETAYRPEDRDALRELLHCEAILLRSKEQRLLDRAGRPMAWLFYSWAATLSADGARLAGRCILDALRNFESTQLATYGYTGLPLLMSSILLGGGRYSGLVIRDKAKEYGSCRQIEGVGDRSRPVVLIDDSLVSGTSFYNGVRILESHGYRVEGIVCLVNFPGRGGKEWAEGLGFRVAALFDIWRDLDPPLPSSTLPSFVLQNHDLSHQLPLLWPGEDVLHPAELVRQIARQYLEIGSTTFATGNLDGAYDTRGGVFVSLRDRVTDRRIARDGYIFLDDAGADPVRDLALATIKTVRNAEEAIRRYGLHRLKIGISFFGPLEEIVPAQMDADRYGLVIRSRLLPLNIGASLPHTQFCTNEMDQYLQTRNKASVSVYEPHAIYRHTVSKVVELGASWLPYGAPQDDGPWEERAAQAVLDRARYTLRALIRGSRDDARGKLDNTLIPHPINGVIVSLYHRGEPAGCWVHWGESLDECITRATQGAWQDARWNCRKQTAHPDDIALLVSLLHHPENIGRVPAHEAATKLRLGLDALAVSHPGGVSVILPHFACYEGWTAREMADAVVRKAGTDPCMYTWFTFQSTSCLDWRSMRWPVAWGFPCRPKKRRGRDDYTEDIGLLSGYIVNHIQQDGLPAYAYRPLRDEVITAGSIGRKLLALTALGEAGAHLARPDLEEKAAQGLRYCTSLVRRQGEIVALQDGDKPGGIAAECQLLLALTQAHGLDLTEPSVVELAAKVRRAFHKDGAISELPEGHRIGADHDLLPGLALTALARYYSALEQPPPLELDLMRPQLAWYRRRFRAMPDWVLAGHQMQGWTAMYELTGDDEQAAFVFEMADWLLRWQLEKNGSFLTGLHVQRYGFHTAFIAEGIADAWNLALRLDDTERAACYAHSWHEAMRFMDSLTLREKDMFCMPNGVRALGGVRPSEIGTEVRIDYVAHLLRALIKGCSAL